MIVSGAIWSNLLSISSIIFCCLSSTESICSIIPSYWVSIFFNNSLSINVSILLLKAVIFLSKSLTFFDTVVKLIILLFFITECISSPNFAIVLISSSNSLKSLSIFFNPLTICTTLFLYVFNSSIFFLVISICFKESSLVIDLLNSFILPSNPFNVMHICSLFSLNLSIDSTIPLVFNSLFVILFTYLPFTFVFIFSNSLFIFPIFSWILDFNFSVFIILFRNISFSLSNCLPYSSNKSLNFIPSFSKLL